MTLRSYIVVWFLWS